MKNYRSVFPNSVTRGCLMSSKINMSEKLLKIKLLTFYMKYDYPEHTSDTFIRGFGRTLKEAFENTALGLVNYISNNVESKEEKIIEVSSEDIKALVFDFLNQFLVLQDSEGLVFSEVAIKKLEVKNKFRIKAIVKGEKYNPEKHTKTAPIKAITYHEMVVYEEKDNCWIKVLVDI